MQLTSNKSSYRPSKRAQTNRILLGLASAVLFFVLLLIFFFMQVNSNRDHAFETSSVVIDQVEHIIDNNEKKQSVLTDSLKDSYRTKAQAASYILDMNPALEGDVEELKHIAELIGVDEIYLFDTAGVIYSGTTPQYFGYSFDSGEQLSYFKPMLSDKSLTMCQDMVPNTAEGAFMMYAICWNDAGTRMTQVGIEPLRLITELRANELSEIVDNMPSYSGLNIYVTDADTGEIIGTTDSRFLGSSLSSIGITIKRDDLGETYDFMSTVDGGRSYCTAREVDGNIIVVTQETDAANKGLGRMVLFLAVGLLIAIVTFGIITRRLAFTLAKEQKNAYTDQMTGFLNRRAYEEMLVEEKPSPESSLVFISLDVNGLKAVNDSKGHAAGDEFIKGAGKCMSRCFGPYGDLYRIGGDEFAALIYADDDTLPALLADFEEAEAEWSASHDMTMSVSCGCAPIREFPDKSLADIAKIADARMYEKKKCHYGRSASEAEPDDESN